ncbi:MULTISPECIES: MetQ/NlpA family ABC transporter substrate-binding protein [Paenibacillus]|uniref:Methionine ABC transporter substrate-binding protein n=1 Tax=Paenibacillus validus TaxID=44253 RepID=A0A7X3CTS8_9BACL|nr:MULTISPECIES: MetQ/NlpA family ABC transporter substrate-binding protein [Paenibacillus]MUG72772.1 methionine ABC transporter substrate-binding protein [Paenibacillus validus]
MKKTLLMVIIAIFLLMTACSTKETATGSNSNDKTIVFLATNYKLYQDTTRVLAAEVEKRGYKLDYKFISDSIQLNLAVKEGNADANYFQHQAYLDGFNAGNGTNLVAAFEAFYDWGGVFSKKHRSLKDIPDGGTIAIPVEPSNNGRTLVMLQDAGLLKLREGVSGVQVKVNDIVENPHNYKFKEIEYAMLPRSLDDVDAAFLHATVAADNGFDFDKDALAKERKEVLSPDIIATRPELVDSPKIKVLKEAYQSDAMKKAFLEAYGGKTVLVPGW